MANVYPLPYSPPPPEEISIWCLCCYKRKKKKRHKKLIRNIKRNMRQKSLSI